MTFDDQYNTLSNWIKYEHPLNEKIRVFLRIEYLWSEIFGNSTKEWSFTISFMMLTMGLASFLQKFKGFMSNQKLIEKFR